MSVAPDNSDLQNTASINSSPVLQIRIILRDLKNNELKII